jgi:exosortase
MRSGRSLAVGLILASGVVWLYYAVLSSLVRQWASDDNYSHGFFVLPLAAYFVWERRHSLYAAPSRPSWIGAVLVAASLAIFAAGLLGAELFLARISLIGVLAGIVLFVWGRDHFRVLLFPLAFLLLMVPLPAILFNQIALPLQLFASSVGEGAIRLAGVPVLRDGNVLQLPATTLEVVEACSGIRSLVSLLMVAIVLGYFAEQRTSGRIIIALSALPIAIVTNAARVAGTGLASHFIGPWAARGFFHTFSGWLMFVAGFLALAGIARIVSATRGSGTPVLDNAAVPVKC